MTWLDEASAQLLGLRAMLLNEEGWETKLDTSVDGVFGSLKAIPLAGAFIFGAHYSFWNAVQSSNTQTTAPLTEGSFAFYILVQTLIFLIDWAASIWLLALLSKQMNAPGGPARAIVGYNWLQVPLSILQLLPLAVWALTDQSAYAGAISLPVVIIAIGLIWVLMQRLYEGSILTTIALTAMIFVIGMAVASIVTGLAQLFLQPSS